LVAPAATGTRLPCWIAAGLQQNPRHLPGGSATRAERSIEIVLIGNID